MIASNEIAFAARGQYMTPDVVTMINLLSTLSAQLSQYAADVAISEGDEQIVNDLSGHVD